MLQPPTIPIVERDPPPKHKLHLYQLEKELHRQQGKSTLNNIKSSKAPLEISGATTARPEHPNTDEVEENKLKNNFMMIIEVLKEEIKNSLKEMEKKTKNGKISTNPLKKTKTTKD